VFNLSEGERRFSDAHAAAYSMIVIVGIDTGLETGQGAHWYDGAVDLDRFRLRPLQWRGLGPSR
jgi:hypothetical protein